MILRPLFQWRPIEVREFLLRLLKIYEKIWADEPEMIEAKYREIQELYPQIGFSIGKTLSGLLTRAI